jgi:hypothetical protein
MFLFAFFDFQCIPFFKSFVALEIALLNGFLIVFFRNSVSSFRHHIQILPFIYLYFYSFLVCCLGYFDLQACG